MTRHSVLLVDDEPSIVASLARDFEVQNYLVDQAENGQHALQLLNTFSYDLIITDLLMPVIGGMEILRQVKNTCQNTGVFILTGYGDMASAIEALRLGADDYLLKPCDPDELLLRAARFLEKQEAFRTIKMYEEILPMCIYCRKIKTGINIEPSTEKWVSVEEYIAEAHGTMVSHGCCPECYKEHLDD